MQASCRSFVDGVIYFSHNVYHLASGFIIFLLSLHDFFFIAA